MKGRQSEAPLLHLTVIQLLEYTDYKKYSVKQIKNEILASYSSVDNSRCRHILIHG